MEDNVQVQVHTNISEVLLTGICSNIKFKNRNLKIIQEIEENLNGTI